MAQEQTVEATILGVVPAGNGFVDIKTDQGDFGTKFPEAIAEAQAHLGQRVSIAYTVGEARQNPQGGWYPQRRYFKRVASPGYVQPQPQQAYPQAAPQQSYPQPQPMAQVGPSDREMQIMRQAAAKCAVWTMPLVPSEQRTFQNQLAIAEAWVRYFIGGIEGTGLTLGNGQQAVTQEQQMMAMAGPAGPGDDIPF